MTTMETASPRAEAIEADAARAQQAAQPLGETTLQLAAKPKKDFGPMPAPIAEQPFTPEIQNPY